MSRYGKHEDLSKRPESPYPPILDFVPDPPFPSASSSVHNIPGSNIKETSPKTDKWNEQSCDEGSSEESSISDWDDLDNIPDYPFNPNALCSKSVCPKTVSENEQIQTLEEEYDEEEGGYIEYTEDEEEQQLGELKTKTDCPKKKRHKRRLVEIQTRISDISIREEEYERALNSGKISIRGKSQQLFEPILGEVTPESDRIDFHFFLKKSGILSIIARSILTLYDEPNLPEPEDALEYMINAAGYKLVIRDIVKEMKSFKESLLIHYQRLSVENDWLHRALDLYEPTELSLNGREPDAVSSSPRGPDHAQHVETFFKIFKDKFPIPQLPSKEEQTIAQEFEDGMISLEDFDTKRKDINPNYLDFSDTSSDEDQPKTPRKVEDHEKSIMDLTTGVDNQGSVIFHHKHDAEIKASNMQIKSSFINDEEELKTNPSTAEAKKDVKPKKISLKVEPKANLPKSSHFKRLLKKKAISENAGLDLTMVVEEKIMKQRMEKKRDQEKKVEEEELVEDIPSAWDPVDTNYYNRLNKQIANDASDEEISKIPKHWFSYDYTEDEKDHCGMGMERVPPQKPKTSIITPHTTDIPETEKSEEEDIEEVPILYDTTDDETGIENVLPQMAGHLILQKEFSPQIYQEFNDDKEFQTHGDYQEPELSSEDEIFGFKLKSKKKFRVIRDDKSEDGSDSELKKIAFGDEQLIDVLEMTPIVPYSSSEDEVDADMEETRSYEFPIIKSTITPHLRHIQSP